MSLWVESMNRRNSTRRACSGARLGSRLRQAHHIRSALGKRWESKPSLTYSLFRCLSLSLSLLANCEHRSGPASWQVVGAVRWRCWVDLCHAGASYSSSSSLILFIFLHKFIITNIVIAAFKRKYTRNAAAHATLPTWCDNNSNNHLQQLFLGLYDRPTNSFTYSLVHSLFLSGKWKLLAALKISLAKSLYRAEIPCD